MTKKKLNLSALLAPLDDELQDTLVELCSTKKQDSPLFDAAIDEFITKYGGTGFSSLEELLTVSATQANFMPKDLIPLDELLVDLTPNAKR